MNRADHWPVVEQLLDQALELGPEDRMAFLDRSCSGDPGLRLEVERLLGGIAAASDFLEVPAPLYASGLVAWTSDRHLLPEGTQLGGYTITRRVGRGGMATVYLAQDDKHHREVAIKVIHPELANTVGPVRFLREIQITAGLRHPHILPLYDSGSIEGLLYYVMPYVAGESLRQRLDRDKRLPIEEAVSIARNVSDALDYAHRQGVVHRDIKPENILLQDRQAVLADFGIAQAMDPAREDRLTAPGAGIGTASYMSPEQASSETVIDGRADIYALGCVLYEMLAGEPPFNGRTRQLILARHAVDPVPSLRAIRRKVPLAIEAAITRALQKLPADRFSTAAEFSEAIGG